MKLRKKNIVLLLTSYCEANEDCTDRNPCMFCLPMCNIFELTEDATGTLTGVLGNKPTRDEVKQ